MTPGYAKPRSELPWLPYPEKNKVFVINSHNFGPANIGFGDELLILRGPTGVTDQSGNGNDGAYQGGMGVVSDTDAGGIEAFLFDGTNDYIQLPVVQSGLPLTLGAWVKISTGVSFAPIIGIYSSTSGTDWRSIGTRNVNNTDYAAISRTSGGLIFTSPFATIGTGTWRLFVAVFRSATDREFYVDGASVGTSATSNAPTGLDRAAIGYNWDSSPSNFFNGRIDDARILNRVLTGTEISDWYAGGRGYNA